MRRQQENVANVSLDSLETSAKCANVAIVKMKQYVMCQLVNVTYVNLDLVDTSAQVNRNFYGGMVYLNHCLEASAHKAIDKWPFCDHFLPFIC